MKITGMIKHLEKEGIRFFSWSPASYEGKRQVELVIDLSESRRDDPWILKIRSDRNQNVLCASRDKGRFESELERALIRTFSNYREGQVVVCEGTPLERAQIKELVWAHAEEEECE